MVSNSRKLLIASISGCLVALAVIISGFGIKADERGDKQTKVSITVEQMIEAIRTAAATKAGKVRGTDVESEDGKVLCEVEILGEDGKTYEVEVDVATNTVVEVEEDDDDDEDDGNKD